MHLFLGLNGVVKSAHILHCFSNNLVFQGREPVVWHAGVNSDFYNHSYSYCARSAHFALHSGHFELFSQLFCFLS